MNELHALLKRQLRKQFGGAEPPESITNFLTLVNEAYHQADDDRRMLERAFELSSQELLEANADLAAALDALGAAMESAEEASQAKDEFLAILGHELRNPLAPLVTALDVARLKGTSAIDSGLIERPLRQVVRLVEDLLDVARVARGTIVLEKRPLELSVAVKAAVEAVVPAMDLRNHSLAVDVPESGLLVAGDETRLVQVIANLLTNATRHTAPNGSIWIAGFRRGPDVVLEIRDNGCGIDPGRLPNLFDAFRTRSAAQRSAGLGLGLTIVRNMVALHGGSVAAHSDGVGFGATFEVRLPPLSPDTVVEPRDPPPLAERPHQSLRVLIVDDNFDAADLLAEALRDAGHETELACSAHEALARAKAFRPEVAVLDVGLPDMSGHELGGRLRELCSSDMGLIAVTGYGQEADRDASTRAGFTAHLVKPVQLRTLLHTITACAEARGAYGAASRLSVG